VKNIQQHKTKGEKLSVFAGYRVSGLSKKKNYLWLVDQSGPVS